MCYITCCPVWSTDTWTGTVYYEIELGCTSYEYLVTVGKDNCTVKLHHTSSYVVKSLVLFSFYIILNCKWNLYLIYVIKILTAGKLESRCLSTNAFVREVGNWFDSFIGVSCYTECGEVLEHWKNAVDKAKSWIFLDKEYKNCAKMRYIH